MPFQKVTYSFTGLNATPSACELTIYRKRQFDVVIIQNSEIKTETSAIKRLQSIISDSTYAYH